MQNFILKLGMPFNEGIYIQLISSTVKPQLKLHENFN